MSMTVRDICKATWDITELDIVAREPESLEYLHEFIIGENPPFSAHIRWEVERGRMTVSKRKINTRGDKKKNGTTEGGWSVKTDMIPDELLEATVVTLQMYRMAHTEKGIFIQIMENQDKVRDSLNNWDLVDKLMKRLEQRGLIGRMIT